MVTHTPIALSSPAFDVYALQYGQSWFRTKHIVSRPLPQTFVPFAWLFYLVVTPTRKILIDTGFVQKTYIRRFGIRNYQSPAVLLARLNIKTSDITDVIVTHSHFDHAGGVALFRSARVYLHKYTHHTLRHSRSLPKVRQWIRFLEKQRRLVLVKHSLHVMKHLRIVHVGGHTHGSMVVELHQPDKIWVFVGDECYLQVACYKGWTLSPRAAVNLQKNQKFLQQFQQKNHIQHIPLTGHDPAIFKQYPKVVEGVVRIQMSPRKTR